MWHIFTSSVLLLLVPLIAKVAFCEEGPPVVTTSQGRITGTTLRFSPVDYYPEFQRTVDAYLGIPYGEPPVGPLRFKPPVAKSWSEELMATELGNACSQPRFPLGIATVTGNISEDCLVLDVFVPREVPPQAAVLVYIHGGAFMYGAGSVDTLFPTPIAVVGDVIVVTLNYRLGALGFMSTGDDVIQGNMGLLDQRLALEWVRDNIKAFGGDPERVAVFGTSAGAGSIGLHMLSPESARLFRGAIMESGNPSAPWATVSKDKARRRAFTLGGLVGCERDTSEELLECLQNTADVDALIENQQGEAIVALENTILELFVPVEESSFLPESPSELHAKGAVNDASTIIGVNADEGMAMAPLFYPTNYETAPFVNKTSYETFSQICTSFISDEPLVSAAATLLYTDAACVDNPECDYLGSLSQVCGDILFVCSADKTARGFSEAGRNVYRYHMTHVPTTTLLGTPWTGATHGDEVAFVFGLPLVESDLYTYTEEEARMAIQVIRYWSNLAKTGNPNLSSVDAKLTCEEKKTEWPLFTVEGLEYKDLSPEMLNGRGIAAQKCRLWNEFVPELLKTLGEC
ncbi:acetylcholinesterase-like [Asterias amurensis]|uniref:acetylcholinesterase-like n=1 Tax=Asterias amurensis TaxID=7602 RepID=UPI003AB14126